MREIRTSGSMSGGGRRSQGRDWGTGTTAKAAGNSYSLDLQQPRPPPTLPSAARLLAKALAAIEKSGQALIVETSKLIPSQIRKADAHDVNAANRAERLTDLERVLAQAESGDGPVIYPGKGPGLYSAPLPDLPSLRAASRTS